MNEYWKDTDDLINMVDEIFDIKNSHKFRHKQLRYAFKIDSYNKINVLHIMTEIITIMQVKHPQHKGLFIFEKGIILSSLSPLSL